MSNNKGSLVWHSSPVCFGSLSAFSLLAHWSLFIDIVITIITNYWNETCITDFPLPTSALQIHMNWVQTTQGTLLISPLRSFYYYELETKLSKIKQNPWGPAFFLRQNLCYFAFYPVTDSCDWICPLSQSFNKAINDCVNPISSETRKQMKRQSPDFGRCLRIFDLLKLLIPNAFQRLWGTNSLSPEQLGKWRLLLFCLVLNREGTA